MEMEMAEGRLGRVIALRLKPGTDVLLGLTEACKRAGINNGVILSTIGSLGRRELLQSRGAAHQGGLWLRRGAASHRAD